MATADELLTDASEDVKAYVAAVEAQGWRLNCVRGSKLRYWCSCDKGHQVWIETRPKYDNRVSLERVWLARRSCWKEATDDE